MSLQNIGVGMKFQLPTKDFDLFRLTFHVRTTVPINGGLKGKLGEEVSERTVWRGDSPKGLKRKPLQFPVEDRETQEAMLASRSIPVPGA